ncbi:MAG: efflux family protein [Actinotalea sp.]|nr:efflux family protein [Actinotalea sp.]
MARHELVHRSGTSLWIVSWETWEPPLSTGFAAPLLWTGNSLSDRSPDGHRTLRRVPRRDAALDRQITRLALPALGALVAEPLFVLVDSAVVGRLGTAPLAGLALASTVLTTVVGLCVFLAYATTAAVARTLGAGDHGRALRLGVDGMWLGLLLGVVLAVTLWTAAPTIVHLLGAPSSSAAHAEAYLRWSAPGLPGMLVVLGATGALRGMLDVRTPVLVAVGGAVLNAILSVVLVLGAGLGVAGAGLGTAISQVAMAVVLAVVVGRGARAAGVTVLPTAAGLAVGVRSGTPLLVRTVSLRLAILLAAWVATGMGTVALAGHQVVMALWGLAAFALDALAIAAQALVGHALGSADLRTTRAVLRRTLEWGVAAGAVLGLLLGALGWWLGPLFSDDPAVHRAVALALVVVAVTLPMAGWVFVLDGVLIGAGDGRYLAWAGVVTLAVYAPAALAVRTWAEDGPAGLAWSWLAFAGVFMAARALTTGVRARGTRWMVTGG